METDGEGIADQETLHVQVYNRGAGGKIDIHGRGKDRPGSGTLPPKASLEILVRKSRRGEAI